MSNIVFFLILTNSVCCKDHCIDRKKMGIAVLGQIQEKKFSCNMDKQCSKLFIFKIDYAKLFSQKDLVDPKIVSLYLLRFRISPYWPMKTKSTGYKISGIFFLLLN